MDDKLIRELAEKSGFNYLVFRAYYGENGIPIHALNSFAHLIAEHAVQDYIAENKKDNYDSWVTNPDRSGGQFTDEEINRSREWR